MVSLPSFLRWFLRELQSLLLVDSSVAGLEIPERHFVRVGNFWNRGAVNSTEGTKRIIQEDENNEPNDPLKIQ